MSKSQMFSRPTVRKVVSLAAATSALAGVLAGAALFDAQAAPTTAGSAPVAITTPTNSSVLPFDLPSTAALHGSDKQVFAHYVPWYPLSLDNKDAAAPDYYNKNYVAVNGEGGKYAAHGGLLRDRPFTRGPIANDLDWEIRDMETEIRQAQAAGIDGFVVSVTSFGASRTILAVKDLLIASKNVGNFTIMLRPNMIASGIKALTPEQLATEVAALAKSTSVYRLKNGQLVFSPFMAESMTPEYWTAFLSTMKLAHGEDVAFWPMFLNEMTSGPKYAAVTYGETTWGERTAASNDPNKTTATSKMGRIATVKARGKKWMQAVSIGDARPAQLRYFEPHNAENLRSTWEIAVKGNADAVHLPTWNDYAEGTQIAPSQKMGWAPLDLNSYYLTWYKTGVAPKIVRDAVYVSNRNELSTAPIPYAAVMTIDSAAKVYDEAEAQVFLTAPGKVTVTSGANTATCDAPAGISFCRVPLAVGTVKAEVVRGGQPVSSVTSKTPVVASPAVQDMDYVYTSSLRNGTTTPVVATAAPSATATVTPTAAPSATATVTPTAAPTATATVAPSVTPTAAPTATATPTGKPDPTTAPSATVTPSPVATIAAPSTIPTPTSLAPVVKNVTASADTYVHQLAPTRISGANASLVSRGDVQMNAYLKFDLPTAPVGMKLSKATLNYWVATGADSGSAATHTISVADSNWAEATMTYQTKAAITTTTLGTITGATKIDTAGVATLDAAKLKTGVTTLAIHSTGNDDLRIWSNEFEGKGRNASVELTYIAL